MYFAHIIFAESSVDVKIETGKNDITEHPHYDQPRITMFGFLSMLCSLQSFFCLFFIFTRCLLYVVYVTCNRRQEVMFMLLVFDKEAQ